MKDADNRWMPRAGMEMRVIRMNCAMDQDPTPREVGSVIVVSECDPSEGHVVDEVGVYWMYEDPDGVIENELEPACGSHAGALREIASVMRRNGMGINYCRQPDGRQFIVINTGCHVDWSNDCTADQVEECANGLLDGGYNAND